MISPNSGSPGLKLRSTCARTILSGAVVVLLLTCLGQVATAQFHQGDRFGIRGGIWPHGDIEGSLGERDYAFPPEELYVLDARIKEDASIVPYVELYGLFNLKHDWWLEGSIGWSGRGGIEVGGFGVEDSLLLGSGRIDFFPMFAGVRRIKDLNPNGNPHNVFARAGLSVIFANESADLLQDSVSTYGLYSPGTEAAFGFLVGGGGEFYFSPKFGALLDVNYRFGRFSYARNAKFDLSSIWLGLGLTIRTH